MVLAITAVATALRMYKLAEWPLYRDELNTIAHISSMDSHIAISPLAYLPIIGMVRLFGEATWAWRLWPFLVGVLSVPIVYYIAKDMVGRTGATWGALLVTLAPWHISQSQFARHYPQQALLCLLLVYVTYVAIERWRPRLFIVGFFMAIILVLTRGSSVYTLLAVAAYPLLLTVWKRMRPPEFNASIAMSFSFSLALPAVAAAWLARLAYGTAEPYGFSPLHVLFSSGYYLTPTLVVVALVAGLYGALVKQDRRATVLGLAAFGPMALISMTALVTSAVGMVVFQGIFGFVLLVSWAISTVGEHGSWRSTAALLSLLVGLSVSAAFVGRNAEYFTTAHGYRSRAIDVAEYLGQRVERSDLIYSAVSLEPNIRDYNYDRQIFPNFSPGEVKEGVRSWVVIESDYSTWDLEHPTQSWLEKNADLVEVFPSYIGPRSRTLWVYLIPASSPPESIGARGDESR